MHTKRGAVRRKPLLESARRTRQRQRNAQLGAVRLTPAQPSRGRTILKALAGVLCASGGILVATSSIGTVTSRPDTLPAARQAPATAFFFDDHSDLLADRAASSAPTNGSPAEQRLAHFDRVGSLPGLVDPTLDITTGVANEHAIAADPGLVNLAHNADISNSNTDATAAAGTATPDLAAIARAAADATLTDVDEIAPEVTANATTRTLQVKKGDTLSGILNDLGIGIEYLPGLLKDELINTHLSRLRIGQEFEVRRDVAGQFVGLTAKTSRDQRLTIRRDASGFAVAAIDLPVEKERVVTSGTITHSLYHAAAEADLKQSTIMELADIFQWELDFARDIRAGDQFAIVYDRLFREGKYIGDGDILAAEFISRGRKHQAVRFATSQGEAGYFSPDGTSKRKTFLRHPVDVVRITSHFDPNRLHPVLHQIRAHKGVDYGSAYGSPIRATADGVVKFAGPKSSYGNTVILQHGNSISTLYAHMSSVAKLSRQGARVKQGDIIGFVGNTGRVTGTHLHYEFRVNDTHVDPLKVELPAASPLAAEYRDALQQASDHLLAQMRSVLPGDDQQLASNQVAID